jgi:hypothetical protein
MRSDFVSPDDSDEFICRNAVRKNFAAVNSASLRHDADTIIYVEVLRVAFHHLRFLIFLWITKAE